MSTAQRLLEKLDKIAENDYHEPNVEVHVKNSDTIIKNQTLPDGRVPLCPTCGRDVIPGHLTPAQVQCPKCMTDINLADGMYKYRTLSGNTGKHDGKGGNNMYGSQM